MSQYGITEEEQLDLDNKFMHHPPFGDQAKRYIAIRNRAKDLAYLIKASTPYSREQALAITKLQESVMWANASIAVNEVEHPPEPPEYPGTETRTESEVTDEQSS